MKRNRTIREDAEDGLFDAFLRLKTAADCKAFLHDLCTPAELEAMADRWRVAGMLEEGIPYRTISEKTGVSVTTVTRVARCLHDPDSGYRRVMGKAKE
jgi:TrpR-related protein YerC/YecD